MKVQTSGGWGIRKTSLTYDVKIVTSTNVIITAPMKKVQLC